MNWYSMTSLSRLSLGVLFTTVCVAGCGDDGSSPPLIPTEAGAASSAGDSTASVDTTSVPGTPTGETTGPDEGTTATVTSDVDTTEGEPVPTVDGGDATSELDGSVSGGDGGEMTSGDASVSTGGEECGAQGAVCCAAGGGQGTCDEGYVCENPAGGGLSNSECVVETSVGDGGDVTSATVCGAQGAVCCAAGGGQGTCDEGYVCDNPAGGGLSNSECVAETPAGDGGDATSAAACGAQGELCCSSGGFGGTCDEGFVCNNPAGGGLSNSECVVETSVGDGGDVTSAATCGAQGAVCCAAGGGQGTCDEGYVCDNPAGGGLSNSECVAVPSLVDAGDAATP